jgi:phage baseplate assembly protein V
MLTTNDIARFLQPLRIKFQTAIGRAVLMAVDNSGKTQRLQLQLYGNELIDKVERIQPYGFETNPSVEDSSEVVILSPCGSRSLSFVITVQARDLRPKIATGETQQYTKFGNKVHLKADGSVYILSSGNNNINLKADGSIVATGVGNSITLNADGSITAEAGSHPVNINGGVLTLKGSSVNLKDSGGQPVMLEVIIDKLNLHIHPYDDAGTPAVTGTMSSGGTTLVAGVDSAPDVKAKI